MTNTQSNDFIKKIESQLPDMATSKDLVKLKIFGTEVAVCKARKKGNSPEFIRISKRRILYPKEAVIKFLKDRTVPCGEIENSSKKKL